MNLLPNLPLKGEPDEHTVKFVWLDAGLTVIVKVYEAGVMVDELREHTFRDAYDAVCREYPQAVWINPNNEEEEAP